jgi:predicted nucleic acid-binding protein
MKNDWKNLLMGHKVSLDTNLLIYAVSAEEDGRGAIAKEMLGLLPYHNCVLTLQALSEFAHVGIRKLGLPAEQVLSRVEAWIALFPVIHAATSTLARAIHAVETYRLAFWDAMLWATAYEADVALLFSEDFQHNQRIGGVRIFNPFHSEI